MGSNETGKYFKITENWGNLKIELQESYETLSDEDLHFEAGKEYDLIQRIAKRLNKGTEEVIHIIEKRNRFNSDFKQLTKKRNK